VLVDPRTTVAPSSSRLRSSSGEHYRLWFGVGLWRPADPLFRWRSGAWFAPIIGVSGSTAIRSRTSPDRALRYTPRRAVRAARPRRVRRRVRDRPFDEWAHREGPCARRQGRGPGQGRRDGRDQRPPRGAERPRQARRVGRHRASRSTGGQEEGDRPHDADDSRDGDVQPSHLHAARHDALDALDADHVHGAEHHRRVAGARRRASRPCPRAPRPAPADRSAAASPAARRPRPRSPNAQLSRACQRPPGP
jgi:hypothetical protein